MEKFLKRISSRKFLTAMAVQIASVVALFCPPEMESELADGAVRIAALVNMVLAALGYGKIEAAIDSNPDVTRPDE